MPHVCCLLACLCLNCADGWNDWLYQWIAYDNWNYSRVFDINSPTPLVGKFVWLKCDGLDTVATIRYSGVTVIPYRVCCLLYTSDAADE